MTDENYFQKEILTESSKLENGQFYYMKKFERILYPYFLISINLISKYFQNDGNPHLSIFEAIRFRQI